MLAMIRFGHLVCPHVRPPFVPRLGTLERRRGTEHTHVVERLADDLESGRNSGVCETARNRNRGALADEIEWVGHDPPDISLDRLAVDAEIRVEFVVVGLDRR